MVANFVADVRYAVRTFTRRPLFTAVVVVTLGLGIGSNVAIFSVADAVLFRPLPYERPDELALIWTRLPATNVERSLVSGPDLQDYREETSLFTGFAGAIAISGTLTGDGPAEQVTTGYSSWNLFSLLGVRPLLGRLPEADDAFAVDPEMFGSPDPDLPPGKVVLSYGLWQRRFGADSTIVGRTIQMDGWGSEVVGVLPPEFRIDLPADAAMPTNVDAWGVLPTNISEFARDAPWLTVVARLRPGVGVEQAQAEMDRLAAQLRSVHPFHARQNMQILVRGMHRDAVDHARPALLALLGAAACVLLIACVNIANLLLVRASGRGREIAVRAAMGSGRPRIVAQMLTESLVLAAGGAALGVLLAAYGVRIIAAVGPGDLPRLDAVAIDLRVLLFTAALAALTALGFGLAPALRAVRGNLADALKDRGSEAGGVRGNKLRTGLAASEVAVSLVLLTGAGLLLRSFAEIQRVDPGFDADDVITFSAPLQFIKYLTSQRRADFVNELGTRLTSLPGVERVGGVTPLPLTGGEQYSVGSYGRLGDPDDVYQANKADFRAVLPGYFETMRIRLLVGRTLEPLDNTPEAMHVAVIDQKLARRVFGDDDPLDRELVIDHFSEETFSLERLTVRVVGVVADVRSTSLASESRETIYVPYIVQAFLPVVFVVRTRGEPGALVTRIRDEIAAMDPDVPLSSVATLESYVTASMARPRFMLLLVGVFAGLALVLASLGLYGVISYSARQRTREIGVRVAFGASEGDVVRLVLGQGIAVAGAGIVLGLVTASLLAPVVESLLVGVRPTDPLTFASVSALLLLVAAVASYLPARRASGIDPVEALRDE
jgi:putative ABC transport system permease protein